MRRLRTYCLDALEKRAGELTPERQEAATAALAAWGEPEFFPAGLKQHAHNVTLPNHMSLLRAWRSMEEGGAFIGQSEAEYTTLILESIKAVFAVRLHIGIQPLHSMTLLSPPLILAEPAFFRHIYPRMKPAGLLADKVVAKALRTLQTQKTLCNETTEEFIKELQGSPQAQALIAERRHELDTLTLAVGLKAAQTCSAVMRLSPGVNHVFPALSVYAVNIRSNKMEARLKTRRLFEKIQSDLKQAVGCLLYTS
ncbi:MAG TPA: hypothetical protein DCG91_00620, partial [Clostridiales bacterium UBA9857]|nr:hypothetical protein [Clostridiales bacterium UBA9857]